MEDSLEDESAMYITQSSSSMAAPVIEGNEFCFLCLRSSWLLAWYVLFPKSEEEVCKSIQGRLYLK